MKRIYVTDDTKRVNLGFRGENEVREIVFDLTDLISDYGEGTAVLLAKRSQDISAYQVSEIVQSGTTLTWTVNQDIDSAYAGNGQAEIFWYLADEALAKTKVYPTYCTMDIGVPAQTPPDPYETWIDTLTELGAETLANAEAAQNAQTGAETAQGKAEEAQGKAETAQEKAETAQGAAEYAQGKAEDAQEAAETAQGLAEAAADRAEDAEGAILNLTASASVNNTVGTPSVNVTVTESGGNKNMAFAFSNLKGAKGDTGSQGLAATVAVGTVTTGAAGSNAEVTNVGSANDAIFNFKIPKGDKGNTGATGADGYSPSASVSKVGTTTTITITDKDGTTTAEVEDGITPTIDSALSPTSTNPVQNKVVTTEKADIITDTASGAIASFPDGAPYPVLDLQVGIDPVQDLHGQANPYPAGGGKNLFDGEIEQGGFDSDGLNTNSGTRIRQKNYTAVTAGQSYTVSATATGVQVSVSFYAANDYTTARINATGWANLPSTFTIPAGATYLRVLFRYSNSADITPSAVSNTQLESGSSATSYAPYSNICPITGWTGANLQRTGGNVFSATFTTGKNIDASGNVIDAAYRCATINATEIEGGKVYRVAHNATTQIGTFFYNNTDTFISYIAWTTPPYTFTAPSNATKVRFTVLSGAIPTNFQVQPYTTIPISWNTEAGTVYGGTDKPIEGKVASDIVIVEFDGSNDETWTRWASAKAYYTTISTTGAAHPQWMISNQFKWLGTLNSATMNIGEFLANGTTSGGVLRWNGNISFKWDAEANDVAGWRAYLSEHPVQVAYKIEPIEYTHTPITAPSILLGDNNLWADCGDTSVTYRADTQRYIQKLTGSTEEDMIANANIAANKYFMVGGNLYYSTASIASGETIVVGTNCTATNLADALNALNA